MRIIIKSCFDQTNSDYLQYLTLIMDRHDELKAHGISLLGEKLGYNVFQFMVESFKNAAQFPSEKLFLHNFSDLPPNAFDKVPVIPIEDFHVNTANFLSHMLDIAISNKMKTLVGSVAKDGMTQAVTDELEELKKLSNKTKIPDIQLRQNARENYNIRSKKAMGMKTGIKRLDELIGGMNEGTVSVIAGFTGHYKTMFAVNVAYLNAYSYGYNIAYFSLETPKEIMYDQLLGRHSYDMKFSKCEYIPHDKIRKCLLTQEEQDYLFDEIEPDLYLDYQDPKDQSVHKRGTVTFFDQSDFETFSFAEITNVLEALDDKHNGLLDAVVVDYAQLCKFTDLGSNSSDPNSIINSYVAFFRKLAQGFRSGSKKKKLIVILLSQINRESWRAATKIKKGNNDHLGVYDLTCLADANELERGAARIFTTFTSENMKTCKEAQVQLLKNRNGATLYEPEKIFADPEAYVFGEELESYGQTIGGTGTIYQNSIADTLSIWDSVNDINKANVFDDLFGQ